ncbi:MAG TPA: hypothetical protein VNG95_02735, partial [Gemmatimonadales bacterium]|nr:hypothetical protein [Gemmatimonadales bacterium]
RSMNENRIDLGAGHSMEFFSWAPDDLPANRATFGFPLPDVPKAGLIIYHPDLKHPGAECVSGLHFDLPELRRFPTSFPNSAVWQVESWEPLTISPSVLCMRCGDHGFIKAGRWVPA